MDERIFFNEQINKKTELLFITKKRTVKPIIIISVKKKKKQPRRT